MHFAWLARIFLSLILLAATCLPAFSQSSSPPYDTFNDNSANQNLVPNSPDNSTFDIYVDSDSPAEAGAPIDVDRIVDSFKKSLPNDPTALMAILDRLLRKRVDNWRRPSEITLTLWVDFCEAVIDKAGTTIPSQPTNNYSPQSGLRLFGELRCLNVWSDAYHSVLNLFPHNGTEEIDSQRKAQALSAIQNAEMLCPAPPPAMTQQSFPPLAPQRPIKSASGSGPYSDPGEASRRNTSVSPNQMDGMLIASVEATLDRQTGTLTVRDVQTDKSVTLHVVSGNGQYGIGYPAGQGADGRYDDLHDRGPIPKGDYLIGNGYHPDDYQRDHPDGDTQWYRLYGSDGHGGYSYEQLANGRGYLNLHTGLQTDGCVTAPSEVPQSDPKYPGSSKFNQLKQILDNTKPYEYKPGDFYRGWLHVK
jgi:hypothetical protein